jgi:hypothetical protein
LGQSFDAFVFGSELFDQYREIHRSKDTVRL